MKFNTILLVLWTIILLGILLSPISGNPEMGSFRHIDKVAHACLFAITGFISVYGSIFLSAFRHRLLFGIVFGLVLAFGTEFGQSIVPSRDTSLYDLAADIIGLFLGLLSYTLFYCWKKKL